ncbi:MAG: Asp-tRNA(Asn)/Glu-tRNA(Gln) amidotransferase GatCAB subunit B, partial [Spirochaetales bacterium]|nr:Asp-tRNA(Asn)/Glu-tRNA(Gln) amidotransferase GatCAB subunit B [Spirochaetales bacterium]
ESAQDYRYFPEPDLPPFAPSPEFLSARRESMAELPGARKARMKARYGLNETQAAFICDDKAGADFFEAAAALGAPPQALFNWLSTEVQRHFNKNNLRPGDPPLTPRRLASLVDLVEKGRVPPSLAKQILEQVFQTGRDPEDIVAEQSLEPVEDREVLEKLIKEIFAAHPKVAEALKNGDSRQAGFVMGRVMKATGGRAHPQLAQEIIRELSLKP